MAFLFLNKQTNEQKHKKTLKQNHHTSKIRLENKKLKLYKHECLIFFVHMSWSSHNIAISAGS